jgi:D-inositol-3-phosphate glycosyltransferase
LLGALPNLSPEFILIIAGVPTVSFDSYEKYIIENNLSDRVITYLRFIEDDEMNYLVQYCDLVVLPYKKIFQSGVLLNVLSQKALILSSDLEPNKETIIDGVNGFLFKSESVASLVEKVKYIFKQNPNSLKSIKQNGFKTVIIDYDWNVIVLNLLDQL